MNSDNKHNMSRRHFLKVAGGTAVASSALLYACGDNNNTQDGGAIGEADVPKDKMTYRTNHNTGDRVSLLGYGMMRLPVEGGDSGRENPDAPIDQELVNKEIDFALEHGVNYIDTSPAYCQGRSEKATGIVIRARSISSLRSSRTSTPRHGRLKKAKRCSTTHLRNFRLTI